MTGVLDVAVLAGVLGLLGVTTLVELATGVEPFGRGIVIRITLVPEMF